MSKVTAKAEMELSGCCSNYYNLNLTGIRVQGISLQVDASTFDGKYGTVLDSGTTYAYLPHQAFEAFKEAVSSSRFSTAI